MNWNAVVLDLDGVIYRGGTVVPGSADAVRRMREAGRKVRFLTNNATRTSEGYAEKLRGMGIPTEPAEVLTSGMAAAFHIRKAMDLSRVFVVGSRSLKTEMTRAGIELVDWDEAEVVVSSLDQEFTYQKLYDAMRAVRKGCPLLSTNRDPVVPDEKGFVPGAGSITVAIETAADVKAINVGKPSSIILQVAEATWGLEREHTCIVGDRLDTDMVAGNSFGWRPVLVLSGSTKASDLKGDLPPVYLPAVAYRDLSDFVSAELGDH